jgi:hypothetical protein
MRIVQGYNILRVQQLADAVGYWRCFGGAMAAQMAPSRYLTVPAEHSSSNSQPQRRWRETWKSGKDSDGSREESTASSLSGQCCATLRAASGVGAMRTPLVCPRTTTRSDRDLEKEERFKWPMRIMYQLVNAVRRSTYFGHVYATGAPKDRC